MRTGFVILLIIFTIAVIQPSVNSQENHVPSVAEATTGLPRLLDLGAGKCIPCQKMAPILEQMEKDFHKVLTVQFIDVWKSENRQTALDLGIESIPTQIFYDESGKELWRHVGFISRQDMLAKWQELGYRFNDTVNDAFRESSSESAGKSSLEEGTSGATAEVTPKSEVRAKSNSAGN
ncbi:MAG: thioredoxin [Candidatus Wallbacteria bacterium HGW-Wallbacteria-1]|jgi:thioredoxin 1|uniref:Thioredoxin n=1 Tax=Candidatus Wallbacteria bacterium HGW-Wallbacteria-1 TaxID=2013854 RepID=A0A2N1PMH9_9BACT|nr:MAG: thioredoxin [Candidatus Wallbacteria bacterium HGW-Wallbacteria-1]